MAELEETEHSRVLCFGDFQQSVLKVFDIKQNQWSEAIILPFQIEYGMSAKWFGGYVYFMGGGEGGDARPSTRVLEYNPTNNGVNFKANLNIPVFDAGMGVLANFIYIVNGTNEKSENVRTVQRYDPADGTCEEVAHTQTYHFKPWVLNYFNNLYVLGAYEKQNIIECYNPNQNTWTKITDVPGTYEWLSTIYNGKLFIAPEDHSKEFKVYDFDSGTWNRKMIKGTPKYIYGLYTVRLEGKERLFLRDEDMFRFCDGDTNKWGKKTDANQESWSRWETFVV